jgi:putative ABC transport system ATP-binding protein
VTAPAAPPPPAAPAVEARSLYRFYRSGDEETLALRGVSLAVVPGEVVAVAGPSGSGKSTLLSCLAGLDEPDGGTVLVGGTRMSGRPEAVRAGLRARRVGVLLQTGNLLDHLTVRQNIRLAQQVVGGRAAVAADVLLASVRLDHRAGAYPGQLSGGEAARAGLAVAVANDPDVLLADEPSGELDEDTEQAVLELLLARAEAGAAVVVASHSNGVRRIATRVVALVDGQVAG